MSQRVRGERERERERVLYIFIYTKQMKDIPETCPAHYKFDVYDFLL